VKHDESDPVVKAHRRSSNHREELTKSTLCGCFYCLETYTPGKIDEWIDDDSQP
jgi:hypothetical protein